MASQEPRYLKSSSSDDTSWCEGISLAGDTTKHRGSASIERRVGLLIAAQMHYRRSVRQALAAEHEDSK
jgi:hypothetical protein